MKVLFLTTCLFFSLNLWGQLETDKKTSNWIIGSDFNFSTQKNAEAFIINSSQAVDENNVAFSRFKIAPYTGKQLDANWLVGLQIGYEKATTIDPITDLAPNPSTGFTEFFVNDRGIVRELSFATFARRYFGLTDNLQAFIQPSLSYSIRNLDDSFIENTKSQLFSIGIAPGISWSPLKRLNVLARFSSINYWSGKKERKAAEVLLKIDNFPNDGTVIVFPSEDTLPSPFEIMDQSGLETSFSEFNANFGLSSFLIGVEFKW